MRWNIFIAGTALALLVALGGCTQRGVTNQVDQGAHGPTSPAESGQHGAHAYPPAPADEYQTAGLLPEYTNGKVDPTMEGSGNLAWQGSYEREKRAQQPAATQQPGTTGAKPASPKSL